MDIWYTSYGSNLCEDRFLCYILGLQPEGSQIKERGCRDKTRPKENKLIVLPYQLYFAKERSKWGKGGVAFIDHKYDKKYSTIGRMYRISDEQFKDVVAQENKLKSIDINLLQVKQHGFANLGLGWYDRIVYLGEEEGAPIFTFTNGSRMEDMDQHAPASPYRSVISKGLSELGLAPPKIHHYLQTAINE